MFAMLQRKLLGAIGVISLLLTLIAAAPANADDTPTDPNTGTTSTTSTTSTTTTSPTSTSQEDLCMTTSYYAAPKVLKIYTKRKKQATVQITNPDSVYNVRFWGYKYDRHDGLKKNQVVNLTLAPDEVRTLTIKKKRFFSYVLYRVYSDGSEEACGGQSNVNLTNKS